MFVPASFEEVDGEGVWAGKASSHDHRSDGIVAMMMWKKEQHSNFASPIMDSTGFWFISKFTCIRLDQSDQSQQTILTCDVTGRRQMKKLEKEAFLNHHRGK